jgi:hypothetical protein
MITKRVLIELVQNRLAGGDVPSDLQGKYPKPVISRLIGMVYSDMASQNKKSVRNMALPYECTVMTANGQYYIVLPVSPINGVNGIVWISKGQKFFPVSQGIEEANIMSYLLPMVSCSANRIVGNKLYFSANPNETTLDLEILPDFVNLSENDNVCVEGVQAQLFSMVMQMMREQSSQIEEVYNNRVPDTDKPTQPAK